MNLDVVRAMSLAIVGNGAVADSNLSGFWSDSSIFTFAPQCAFLDREGGAVIAAAAFAHVENEPNFEQCFTSARDALAGKANFRHTFFAELERFADIPREAKRILTALPPAWVFGGMGSWNDTVFEGESRERYGRLTAALFDHILEGVTIAANATYNPRPAGDGATRPWWQRLFASRR